MRKNFGTFRKYFLVFYLNQNKLSVPIAFRLAEHRARKDNFQGAIPSQSTVRHWIGDIPANVIAEARG